MIAAICPFGILPLKNIDDFSKLEIYVDALAQPSNISFKCLQSATDALVKTRLSSVKSRWDIVTLFANLNPRINYSFLLAPISLKNSTHIMKRYEESGHPFLRPFSGCIKPFGAPLIITKKEAVMMQLIIKFTHLFKEPSFAIVYSRNCHLILSYASLISNFSATKPFLFPLLCLILWRHT